MQRRLSMLSESAVREEYVRAHAKCWDWTRRFAIVGRDSTAACDLEDSLAMGTECKASLGPVVALGLFVFGATLSLALQFLQEFIDLPT
jgi:hypothetical protein